MLQHLALGSNLGDRAAHLRAAAHALSRFGALVAFSPTFETAPLGPSRFAYLNAAAAIDCALDPQELVAALLEIEKALGRRREQRWGDRCIDLDLLLCADRVIDGPGCRLPHPELHRRGFVLAPLVCIAAEQVVPTLGRSVRSLFDAWCAGGEGVALARGEDLPRCFGHDLGPLSSCGKRLHATV